MKRISVKKTILFIVVVLLVPILPAWAPPSTDWIVANHQGYELHYTPADSGNVGEYVRYMDRGIASVQNFFGGAMSKEFDVFVYPSRLSLDTQWRIDWKLPDFKSECWMVASGVSKKLDILSPKLWDKESCEHSYRDTLSTQRIITHELVHVYHGQWNASADFSDVTGLDWFVEGLATYASGQCDSARIAEVKKELSERKVFASLDTFWTGKLRYGLSGSVVMYVDAKYGRGKLKELLKFNRKTDLLGSLGLSEADLLAGWKQYIVSL